jgi:dTDP-4-dehydrorhamnose 3,5-epimerase
MGRPVRGGDPEHPGDLVNFEDTEIPGVAVVDLDRIEDDRGFFARSFCAGEFADRKLCKSFVQANISFNRLRGTLRGMHYQAEPKPEPKLVRCTRGAIFDVAVDLRTDSPTFRRWAGRELTAENRRALFIPAGCAHGFVSLTDNTEVFYLMGAAYDPALARGMRWNDPAFAIDWPMQPTTLSDRDASYPDFLP